MVRSTGKSKVRLRCPICKKPVVSTNEEFPFCSGRCRTIDLGRWASGAYVIPSPIEDTEKEDEFRPSPGDGDHDPDND